MMPIVGEDASRERRRHCARPGNARARGHAFLTSCFWESAVLYSTWSYNRITRWEDTDFTPYSNLFGHPPDISKARVFGADVWVPTGVKGITDRARKHIFCGIAQNSDGWICFSPSERDFFTTTHASFNEDLSQRRFELMRAEGRTSDSSLIPMTKLSLKIAHSLTSL